MQISFVVSSVIWINLLGLIDINIKSLLVLFDSVGICDTDLLFRLGRFHQSANSYPIIEIVLVVFSGHVPLNLQLAAIVGHNGFSRK